MGLPDEFKNGEKSMGFRKVPKHCVFFR